MTELLLARVRSQPRTDCRTARFSLGGEVFNWAHGFPGTFLLGSIPVQRYDRETAGGNVAVSLSQIYSGSHSIRFVHSSASVMCQMTRRSSMTSRIATLSDTTINPAQLLSSTHSRNQ